MSRPVQSLAPGFLSLLGLKNNGSLPPEMIDALAPVIDVERWYFQGTRENIPSAGGINILAVAAYAIPEFVVPANEVWWVHGFQVQVSVPAAQTWSGFAVHYTPNVLSIHTGARDSAGGAAVQLAQPSLPAEFLASGGDRFGMITASASGAGAILASGYLSVSRFVA